MRLTTTTTKKDPNGLLLGVSGLLLALGQASAATVETHTRLDVTGSDFAADQYTQPSRLVLVSVRHPGARWQHVIRFQPTPLFSATGFPAPTIWHHQH